jgi:hypothetical protein
MLHEGFNGVSPFNHCFTVSATGGFNGFDLLEYPMKEGTKKDGKNSL